MSKWNIAAKSPEEQAKVNVDLAASGVAYKERLNMPVVAEVVAREQSEHLREYFMERVRYYREQSIQLPRASDPRYLEMAEGYVLKLALDKDNQVCGYQFLSLGKMMDAIKKGMSPNEAYEKNVGTYGRFKAEDGAVAWIDPRKQ